MNRRERRNLAKKKKKEVKNYKPISKNEKIITILISISLILSSLYFANRDNSIPNENFENINVTLKSLPEYDEYKIKNSTYRDIILKTKEYQKEFKIKAMTYEATNHNDLKNEIKSGDNVELKLLKSDVKTLNKNSFFNNYNEIYGISKDGKNYVDITLRTKLIDNDINWSYLIFIIGIVILPYAFLRTKPLITLNKAITIICVISLIIMFALRNK